MPSSSPRKRTAKAPCYRAVDHCRICGNRRLAPVLSLGRQALTGLFPRRAKDAITTGPLELVRCDESRGSGHCGLVQLRHSYDKSEMYGSGYGYHSSLNASMVEHLRSKVKTILGRVSLATGDLVIDIGSNDGTLLKAYPERGPLLLGIDPTGIKFKRYYPPRIGLIEDFFSPRALRGKYSGMKAKIITSIAMFYDLDDPLQFMRDVHSCLADDGVWVMEQSYLPLMLERCAYDTICHEHIEYYGLRQIAWMAKRVGFDILDVEINDINGGSFSVTLAKSSPKRNPLSLSAKRIIARERALATSAPYDKFRRRTFAHRDTLRKFIDQARKDGRLVAGYGASTKGNVILQFCGLSPQKIPFIAEVNADKFGCFTPGTLIPIVSEVEARERRPDYFLVLPWHFKNFIIAKEKAYVKAGGRLVFPLPKLEVHPRN